MTAAFAALDRSEVSHATPQLNVLNRVGGSIGTTILAVVLANALVGAHTPAAAATPTAPRSGGRPAIAALAIIPCIVLMRAENARGAAKAAGRRGSRPRRDRVRRRRGGARMSATETRESADSRAAPVTSGAGLPPDTTPRRQPARWAWRSSGRWSRCAGCAGARPTAPASSATPSTDCSSGWPAMCERLRPRPGRARRPLAGDRGPDARTPRGRGSGHAHALGAGPPRRALGPHRARCRRHGRTPSSRWRAAGSRRSKTAPTPNWRPPPGCCIAWLTYSSRCRRTRRLNDCGRHRASAQPR